MKLEVGKAYKARNGEKCIFLGYSNGTYPRFKTTFGYYIYPDDSLVSLINREEDIISEWVDAPKYKAGDVVKLRLSESVAELINFGRPFILETDEVLNHTPAPEPEFDWSTVKAGMAFKHDDGSLYHFVGKDPAAENNKALVFSCGTYEYVGFTESLKYLKRSPEHDIEVK